MTKNKYDIRIESARGKILAHFKGLEMTKRDIEIYAKGMIEGLKVRHKMPQLHIIPQK